MSERLEVRSLFRTYDVRFCDDALQDLAASRDPGRTFVVCDARVGELWGEALGAVWHQGRGVFLDPSEHSKTLEKCQELIECCVAAGVRRDHTLVAVGGGITQDVVAFVASILYRGIDWVFLPTTLLAQADSCIGSKTSINLGDKKNLIGNFYPPSRVLIDLRFLNTLSDGEVRSGIGEILHFYLYADSPLTRPLIREHATLLAQRGRLREHVAESLRIKQRVVELDEFDRGERHKFNYGHTFGHALESVTDYRLPHGQAVTVGMDVANYFSQHLGLMPEAVFRELHELLAVNFPRRLWRKGDLDRYCGFLAKDKKNRGGNVGCILAERPGKLVSRQLPLDDEFRAVLRAYFAGPWWPHRC